MNDNINRQGVYVTFKEEEYTFAIPIVYSLGIMRGDRSDMRYSNMLNAPHYVKYIAMCSSQCIVVVQIPGIDVDTPITDSLLVLLEHPKQVVGVLANEVNTVQVSQNKVLTNRVTGQRHFFHNGKNCLILDIPQLYNQLGI